ncbi:hypothetical protein EV424DRAFT_1349535 [Suillus variegatus]|nr:hypothetical protein EV424DRAFT_1349535 [Suillus variegatus]
MAAAFFGAGGSVALDNARFLMLEDTCALSASRTRAEGFDVRVERREPAVVSAGVRPDWSRAVKAFFGGTFFGGTCGNGILEGAIRIQCARVMRHVEGDNSQIHRWDPILYMGQEDNTRAPKNDDIPGDQKAGGES